MFRTPEEEVKELARELRELKEVLREILNKATQIEARARRTFPAAFPKALESRPPALKLTDPPTISPQEALRLYDDLVLMAKHGNKEEVQRRLETMGLPDLALLARELGVSLGKSKPSRKALLKSVLGRINESMMLSTSSLRQRSERTGESGDEGRLVSEQSGAPSSPQSSGSAEDDSAN